MDFADVEKLLVGWLKTQLTPVRVVTETPANLQAVLPVIQVGRVGGADRDVVIDNALVTVDCFGASREAAKTLAEQVRTALRFQLPGHATTDCVVTKTTTVSAPAWRPWDDTSLRRFGASYQITFTARP